MSYEYLNTRVRVLLAQLLKPAQFEALLGLQDLTEMINFLAETDYAPEIRRSTVEFSGYAVVDRAVMHNGHRVFHKLVRLAPERPRQLIEVVLHRFEVFNLKTILRGLHVGASAEEIAQNLYPTILYPPAFYPELLKKEKMRDVLDYLLSAGASYTDALWKAFPEYERTGKLLVLEHALDWAYFNGARATLEQLKDENAKFVRTVLGTEADVLNLIYALRIIESGVQSEEKYKYILEGGARLTSDFIRELLDTADRTSFFRKLARTSYYRQIQPLDETVNAARFQKRLEDFLYQELCRWDLGRFFDIHMSIAYIWRKTAEMTNLRVIASGLARHAAREQIEHNLISLEVLR